MTDKEKAWAYDEALKKAQDVFHTSEFIKITDLFPELVESEDERIRKEIVTYLNFAESHNLLRAADYEKKKKWLAYLEKQKDAFENGRQFGIMQEQARQELEWTDEKQKEQSITANDLDEEIHRFFDDCIDVHEAKLYGNISERVIPVDCYELTARHFAKWGERRKEQEHICDSAQFEEGFKTGLEIGLRKQKEQKPNPLCGSTEEYYREAYYADQPEKEQKPAEYGDDVVEEAEEYTSKVKCGEYGVTVTEAYIAGVLSERNRKPAEWSEEDEKHLNWIIEHFSQSEELYHNLITWLKSLLERFNLQPKQEWSEEDENNLNKLLQWDGIPLGLRSWVSGLPEKVGTRPSWKPSEEQIEAVRYFVNKHQSEAWVATGQWKQFTALRELLGELNRLFFNRDWKDETTKEDEHWKPSKEQMEALNTVLEHEAERVGSSKELEKANALYEQLKKRM